MNISLFSLKSKRSRSIRISNIPLPLTMTDRYGRDSFEVSLPKYGEAPISVSGIGEGAIDFTIRKVGKVTGEVFEQYIGDRLFLRGALRQRL